MSDPTPAGTPDSATPQHPRDEAVAVERLRELRAKATLGPWVTEYGGQNWWIASCGMGEGDMTVWSPNPPTPDHGGEREDDGGEADRANAAFIAGMASLDLDSLAAALTELERLRRIEVAAQEWAAALDRYLDVDDMDNTAQRFDDAGRALRAALSPTPTPPMPPMPPTPFVPTKEGSPDAADDE